MSMSVKKKKKKILDGSQFHSKIDILVRKWILKVLDYDIFLVQKAVQYIQKTNTEVHLV